MLERQYNRIWISLGLFGLLPVILLLDAVFTNMVAQHAELVLWQKFMPQVPFPLECQVTSFEASLAGLGAWLFGIVACADVVTAITLLAFALVSIMRIQDAKTTYNPFTVVNDHPAVPRSSLPSSYVKGVPPAERPPAPKLPATPPLRAEDVARFESPAPKTTPKLVELAMPEPVTQYYLLVNKERRGPYSAGQLRKQLANKEITRDSLCREVDGSEWLPLLEELLDPKPLCTTCKVEEVEKVGETCPNCRKFMP
jgi:hypothetical protein